MDDDLQQLEAELKRLQPSGPRPRLQAALREALTPRSSRAMPARAWWPAALPVAATIAVAALWPEVDSPRRTASAAEAPPPGPAHAPSATALQPVAVENLLYAARDEGLVTLDDGTTARRQRLRFVDTVTWENPRTKASLTWTVPREEIRIVPVVWQ